MTNTHALLVRIYHKVVISECTVAPQVALEALEFLGEKQTRETLTLEALTVGY